MQKALAIIWLIGIFLLNSWAMAGESNKNFPKSVKSLTHSDKMSEIEVDRLAEAAGIPDKINSDKAYQLLSGAVSDVQLIESKFVNYILSFPIKKIVAITEVRGHIENGKWKEEGNSKVELKKEWALTTTTILVPLALIITFTALIYKHKKRRKAFLVFYSFSIVPLLAILNGDFVTIGMLLLVFFLLILIITENLWYAFFGLITITYLTGALLYVGMLRNATFFACYLGMTYSFCAYSLASVVFSKILWRSFNCRRDIVA